MMCCSGREPLGMGHDWPGAGREQRAMRANFSRSKIEQGNKQARGLTILACE